MADVVLPVPTWRQVKPWLWRVVGFVLICYFAYQVRELWLPLSLALLIAMVLDPVVDRFERRGWGRGWSAALIFGGFILVMGGALTLAVPAIMKQAGDMQAQFERQFPDRSPQGLDREMAKYKVPTSVRPILLRGYEGFTGGLSRSTNTIGKQAMDVASNLVWVVIIPIIAFYALRDFHLILAKGLLLVPPRKRDFTQTMVGEVTGVFARYMRGLMIVSGLNGLATWLLLWAVHVPSALILGIVAGILYAVPYIGAFITVVLTATVSFFAGGVHMMLWAVGLSVILHQVVFDQIITPRILGGHVGLHPILSIIALLAGNALLGIIGMILAVPVAACIQIAVLSAVPKLRQPIDLPPPGHEEDHPSPATLSESAKDRQLEVDATQELHQTVSDAVDNIDSTLRPSSSPQRRETD